MKDMEDKTAVLLLAPRSKAKEILGGQFHLREEGSIGPAATCVYARGAQASPALRGALASPGKFSAIVLVSPPSIDKLDADVAARLREIATPVLALFGTDDEASPPEFGHAWRRGLPKCFVTFVYGADGDMANERPEAVASLVADFLARGEGFLVKDRDERLFP
jgi:pimeloyl-ACP methyl ester carboxylesterase